MKVHDLRGAGGEVDAPAVAEQLPVHLATLEAAVAGERLQLDHLVP